MIVFFIILLVIYLLFSFEKFTPIAFDNIDNYQRVKFDINKENTNSVFENRFKFIQISKDDDNLSKDNSLTTKNYDNIKSDKCCLIKKQLDNRDGFEYIYNKYENDDCDINKHDINHNNQLFYDGINDWSNESCSNKTSKLGSCKRYNFECIDFVTEDQCNEYNGKMPVDRQNRKIYFSWSKKPCYNR